jgi:hypothetical protein
LPAESASTVQPSGVPTDIDRQPTPLPHYLAAMAVIARILVEVAEQSDHHRLESSVDERFQDLGGPPDGLMVHLGYPEKRGLMIVEAWRTEESFRACWDRVLQPALRDVGLVAAEPEVGPAWSIARP